MESERTGSCWESNAGHLWLELPVVIRVFLKQMQFSVLNALMFRGIQICAVSYGTSSMFISSRMQEIYGHKKITNAYRTMKHGLLQEFTAPIVIGMSPCLINSKDWGLSSMGTSQKEGFKRYSCTNLPLCTNIMKNGLFHGLTAPYMMGTSQHFYIPL